MTNEEYEQILRTILATFPELHEYGLRYTAAPPGEESGPAKDQRIATALAQRERRRDALLPLDAQDVRAAIEEFRLAAVVPWNQYGQQGQGFAMIRERARAIAKARRSAQSEASEHERTRDPNFRQRRGAGGLLGADGLLPRSIRHDVDDLLRAKASGDVQTAADVRAFLSRGDDERERDRRDEFYCPLCRDTGVVVCVTSLRKQGSGAVWTTGVAACSSTKCIKGDVFANRKDERSRLVRYDECEHVRLDDPSFAQLSDVLAAIERTRANREKKNRIGAFDEFNQRGAADALAREREETFA